MHNIRISTSVRLPESIQLKIRHDNKITIDTDEVDVITSFFGGHIITEVYPVISLVGEEIKHSLVFALAQPEARNEKEALDLHLLLCNKLRLGTFNLAEVEVIHSWDIALVMGNNDYKTERWWS